MKLFSDSFVQGEMIPVECAFAQIDEKSRVRLAANKNPHLAWTEVPEGALSFVLLCVDRCAPSVPDDVNQTDREISAQLPRADFVHWVLVNVPLNVQSIEVGQFSSEVTPRGKSGPVVAGREFRDSPMRQGINDYTHWFANDNDMNGDYYGYDGPCPPWNDALMHEYTFTVYALNVASLDLPTDGKLNMNSVLRRMEGHVLDEASLMGRYTLNPRLLA